MILGILVLFLGGLCQGSFSLGYKKYPPFSWAAFWAIFSFFCIVCSGGFALIANPGLLSTVHFPPAAFLCGALWGISAICFSKGINIIGISMVNGISMGISTIVGSVVPMIMTPDTKSGPLIYFGLFVTAVGVAIITVAGILRDGGFKNSGFGCLLAVFSGLGTGAQNIGFSLCTDLGDTLLAAGSSPTAVSAAKWAPIHFGGCVAGIIWCIFELTAKKQWSTVVAKGAAKRTGILFGVSIVWYAALLLYGLSTLLMGNAYVPICWIIFNALALLISVLWGIKTGEWKNKPKGLLWIGCIILIIAWIFMSV